MKVYKKSLLLLALSQVPVMASAQLRDSYIDMDMSPPPYYAGNRVGNHWLIAEGRSGGNSKSQNERWENLTPEQRDRIKKRHKQFESLSPEEKERVRKARKQFRELPLERRQELREQWKNMKPEERREKRRKIKDGEKPSRAT